MQGWDSIDALRLRLARARRAAGLHQAYVEELERALREKEGAQQAETITHRIGPPGLSPP